MTITSTVASVASMVGTGVKAAGQVKSADAQAQAQDYSAQVADNNSDIALQNAAWVAEEGVQNASTSEMKTAATVGSTVANQGASGVEVGTGSNKDVVTSERETGQLDAMTIRSNAAREAYGYQVQATNDKAQAGLDRMGAKNDIEAGKINAGTTLLTGASKSNEYMGYLNTNSAIDTGFSDTLSQKMGSGTMI